MISAETENSARAFGKSDSEWIIEVLVTLARKLPQLSLPSKLSTQRNPRILSGSDPVQAGSRIAK
ncbi:MAG TPA: hypothetical protein DEB70_06665 [Planctomycetaceae bacterium]|nr:hypothetical protein [Planctomycetaceae bacterium]